MSYSNVSNNRVLHAHVILKKFHSTRAFLILHAHREPWRERKILEILKPKVKNSRFHWDHFAPKIAKSSILDKASITYKNVIFALIGKNPLDTIIRYYTLTYRLQISFQHDY